MSVIHKSVNEMWLKYKQLKHIDDQVPCPESWYFCNNKKDADDLAGLVLEGTKRATASLHKIYEVENEPMPEVGDLSIITDYEGVAECIIQTTKITLQAFKDVPESFAQREGEGDKSLAYWQKAHKWFFGMEAESYGGKFTEDMLVVCEEFELVFK